MKRERERGVHDLLIGCSIGLVVDYDIRFYGNESYLSNNNVILKYSSCTILS